MANPMAFLRLFLVFVGATAREYGVIPPSAQPPKEQLREQHGAEHSVSLNLLITRAMIWFWAFLEGAILFALSGYCPRDLARPFLHTLPIKPTSDITQLTPAFLAGTALTIAGSLLRMHCFHALGPRFTLQLSIRPTHSLVTDGAYSIVRHPSYTGLIAMWIGYFSCLLDPQGPVVSMVEGLLQVSPSFSESTSDNTVLAGVLACLWMTAAYLLYLVLNGRMRREDAMLEKSFGDEWRSWAKKVPYRLIPGIY